MFDCSPVVTCRRSARWMIAVAACSLSVEPAAIAAAAQACQKAGWWGASTIALVPSARTKPAAWASSLGPVRPGSASASSATSGT